MLMTISSVTVHAKRGAAQPGARNKTAPTAAEPAVTAWVSRRDVVDRLT
jgi:hypothetical protein